jgi:plasmid stabilization system protein ParE
MPRKVTTAPAAAEGFRAARDWLTQPGSGPVGRQKWMNVRDARKRLRDFPYAGPPSPDHPGLRNPIREGYAIVYRVDPDTGDSATAGDVTVLAVFLPGIRRRGLTRYPDHGIRGENAAEESGAASPGEPAFRGRGWV